MATDQISASWDLLTNSPDGFSPAAAPTTLTGQTVAPPESPLTYYLVFPASTSIVGESTDGSFDSTFYQLTDFSFSVQNPDNIDGTSGGAGAGKVTFGPLKLELTQQALTPRLFQQLTVGAHLADIEIVGVGPTGPVTTDVFKPVFTSDIAVDNSGVTSVSLQYGQVSVSAAPPSDGTPTIVPAVTPDLTYYVRFTQQPAIAGGTTDGPLDGSTLYQLSGFSFDDQNTVVIGSGTSGAGGGTVTLNPLNLELTQSVLTPALLDLLDAGTHLKEVDVLGYGPDGALVTDEIFGEVAASNLSIDSNGSTVQLQYAEESLSDPSAPATLTGQTTAPTASPLTYYLVLGPDTISGEATDPSVGRTFYQLTDFSFSIENPDNGGSTTGGAGAGKAKLSPLQLELTQQALTPEFFQQLATGAHFQKIEIVGVGPTGPVTTDVFNVVFTSDISVNDSGVTSVSLQYGGASLNTTTPDDGKLGTPNIVPAVTPDLTYYVRFTQPAIAGETTDGPLDGSTLYQLSGFSFDDQHTALIGSGTTGAGAGTVTFNPLNLQLTQSALTPPLLQLLDAGTRLQEVDVLGYGPDGTLVTDASFGAAAASNLSFDGSGSTVKLQYSAESLSVTPPDGSAPVTQSFDLQTDSADGFSAAAAPATLTGQTTAPTASPETYYLVLGPDTVSIPGETTDPSVGQTFYQLTDFSFGIENPNNGDSTTGGAGAGKVTFSPLKLELTQQALTPEFFQQLTTGAHFQKIEIVGVGPTGPVTTDVFNVVFTSDISVDDSGVTSVSLQYGGASLNTTTPDDGKLGTPNIVPAVTPDLTYYVRFTPQPAIAGETTDGPLDGSTLYRLSGFSFDDQHQGLIGSGTTGAGGGKVIFNPLNLELTQSALTPPLMALLDAGTHLQEVDVLGYGPDGILVTDDSFGTVSASSMTSSADGVTAVSLQYVSESIQTYQLGTFAPVTPAVVEKNQTTVIGTVTLGFAGETLTPSQTAGSGTVSLAPVSGGVQQVIYTAPGSIPASAVDDVSYTISDQFGHTLVDTSTDVQLDAGPTIAPAIPAVVEKGQTTVVGTVTAGLAGDTLTLTQTLGNGTLSLGPVSGLVQQVLYTAPGAIPSSTIDAVSYTVSDQHNDAVASAIADVQLDSGPKAGNATLYLSAGESVDLTSLLLALDTPGLPGDTLTLTGAGTAGTRGTVSLSNGDLVYKAPASGLDVFTYTVSDQLHGAATASVDVSVASKNGSIALTGTGNIVITTDGNHSVSGGTGGNYVSLGSGNDHVSLGGNGNTVVLGDGNDSVTTGDGSMITLGNGNDAVDTGAHSIVTAGNGNDTVTAGAGSSVSLGNGNDLVYAGANSSILFGSGNDTVFAGSNDMITLGKGKDVVAFGVNPSPLTLGNEVVSGFAKGDTLEFNRQVLGSFATAMLDARQMSSGTDTVITIDQNDSVTLRGVAATSLTSNSFKFV